MSSQAANIDLKRLSVNGGETGAGKGEGERQIQEQTRPAGLLKNPFGGKGDDMKKVNQAAMTVLFPLMSSWL